MAKCISDLEGDLEGAQYAVEEKLALQTKSSEAECLIVPHTQLFYATPMGPLVRQCSQWDERSHRFLLSLYEGGMGAVPYEPGTPLLPLEVLVSKPPRPGLSNLGFRIDYPRNRIVSCASDKRKFLLSTLVAYDYTTWETLFVVELAGPESKSCADDLTIGPEGDMYVTDTYNGKIWKVKSDGCEFSVFSDSPLYKRPPEKQHNYGWVRLNGIFYHPHGFLLVTHLASHTLFKVSIDGEHVRMVEGLEGIELLGDGLVLQSNNTLAMAGLELGVHLLETNDDWESATVTHSCPPPPSLLATSVSLKDGHVFASFVNDVRQPHNPELLTIGEPIFRPFINPSTP